MVDELSIPDGFEKPVGETDGEDILHRFLAEKMIDPEYLLFSEDVM